VRAARLRVQLEAELGHRFALPLPDRAAHAPAVSSGIFELDLLAGGLPRGCLTEVFGPISSGRTSVLVSALATMTTRSEVCALVDGRDGFDPVSAPAAGVDLEHLLWVRCGNIEQALKSADLLLHGGGFGLVALDLSDVPPQTVRHVPLNAWFRFRRMVENTPTVLILLEQEPCAKTCASLVLRVETKTVYWSAAVEPGCFRARMENDRTIAMIRPHNVSVSEQGSAGFARRVAIANSDPLPPARRQDAEDPAPCLLSGLEISAEVFRCRLHRPALELNSPEGSAAGMTSRFETRALWKIAVGRETETKTASG
jgi:hypothetical protein